MITGSHFTWVVLGLASNVRCVSATLTGLPCSAGRPSTIESSRYVSASCPVRARVSNIGGPPPPPALLVVRADAPSTEPLAPNALSPPWAER